MTTTTWTINNLDRNTDDGLVTTIHWTATAVDTVDLGEQVATYNASVYNTQQLERGESFVDYATLTEATVLEWLWNKVDKEVVEAALEAQIEAKKAPVKASGLPWVN